MSTAYAKAALDLECSELARTTSGRNERLNRAAFAMGQLVGAGVLDRALAEELLFGGAEACGYVNKDGAVAARATIRSGLDRGERNPRDIGNVRDVVSRAVPDMGLSEIPARRDDPDQDGTDRISKARYLWSLRRPFDGRYLQVARGLTGPFPATLGYLPARGEYPPAMIAAFGIATEPEPGVLAIAGDDVRAVHLTKLNADATQKSGRVPNKIMIGSPKGSPIVLAPPNDLLATCITEGIEDALSAHEATGLGAWAAGSASLMPALADVVPDYIDCVSILAHADPAGIKGANELATRLRTRGTGCVVAFLGMETAA
jgi:hypothetical protein